MEFQVLDLELEGVHGGLGGGARFALAFELLEKVFFALFFILDLVSEGMELISELAFTKLALVDVVVELGLHFIDLQ